MRTLLESILDKSNKTETAGEFIAFKDDERAMWKWLTTRFEKSTPAKGKTKAQFLVYRGRHPRLRIPLVSVKNKMMGEYLAYVEWDIDGCLSVKYGPYLPSSQVSKDCEYVEVPNNEIPGVLANMAAAYGPANKGELISLLQNVRGVQWNKYPTEFDKAKKKIEKYFK